MYIIIILQLHHFPNKTKALWISLNTDNSNSFTVFVLWLCLAFCGPDPQNIKTGVQRFWYSAARGKTCSLLKCGGVVWEGDCIFYNNNLLLLVIYNWLFISGREKNFESPVKTAVFFFSDWMKNVYNIHDNNTYNIHYNC